MSKQIDDAVALVQSFRDVLSASDADGPCVAVAVATLIAGICLMSDSPPDTFETIGAIARNSIAHTPHQQLAQSIKARRAN